MIEIRKLQFKYLRSDFRLSIECLDVPHGQKVAVVGPSGSGKTTLLNLISGINTPDSGSVIVDGQAVSEMSDPQRRSFRVTTIGSVFQQFELIEYLNVRENILLPGLVNNALTLERDVQQRVEHLAERTGIVDKLDRTIDRLSQGEQQRVAICRALLPRPRLILADEPTGNLDPANKQRILELLFSQCEENQLSLISVTHDVNILSGFDRTIDFATFFASAEDL